MTIPFFFDSEKRAEVIKNRLAENYNFKLSNIEKIKYNIFPSPNLELINTQLNFKFSEENLSLKNIKIYPNFLNLYNYKNFHTKKIILNDGDMTFQISNLKFFIKQFSHQKNKISLNNLDLKIIDKNTPVIKLNNIRFANYGYKKNSIKGEVFGKNFKVRIDDNYKNINFKLLHSGIDADINFYNSPKKNIKVGVLKSKILNTNFKSNFEYDGRTLKIYNSYLRSKSLSFKNESEIVISPYFDIKSKLIVEEFSTQIFKSINFTELYKFKDFLRKINSEKEIIFVSKKFGQKLFDDLNLKVNLAYGRMSYSKRFLIAKNIVQCDGSMNFLEEYPLLFFDCFVEGENKREFFKKFSIKTKNKNESLKLNAKGNLSILNKKVNFKNISMDEIYNASKEDLKYFKETFEKIFFDKNSSEIFDLKKVKKFILEIS